MNAFAVSPERQPRGSFFSFLTLPPPSTTSSGLRVAIRRSIHVHDMSPPSFFAGYFSPQIPT